MNLNQTRAVENFKKDFFDNWEISLKQSCPNISIDVDWESLFSQAKDDDPESVANFWKELFFEPINSALESIGRDELGKKALENLKNITIRSTTSSSNSESAVFDNGTFTIDQHGYAYSESPEERATIWQGILEKNL